MPNPYPHSSWNSAERRAQAHSSHAPYGGPVVTVDTLAQYCPVEQGADYCAVCCAVCTDDPAPLAGDN